MAFLDTPLPHVRVLWRPAQFTRCTNPGFETNTSGWSVSGGINEAGTSITRITTDSYAGSASGELVTTTTDGSGVNFDLGSDRYYAADTYGTAYVATVRLKRVSGAAKAKLIFGSEGTASDRTELDIDLTDDWTAYRTVWLPSANRTDAQVAITNGYAAALTVRIDSLVIYQLDAFSQVENSNFTAATTGWTISGAGGIAGAATSLTRVTTDGMDPDNQTCAELVTTATSGSGADYILGNRRFTQDRTYRLRIAMKSVTGTTVRLRLGSIGTGADRADDTKTIDTDWGTYTLDWTPTGNRTDACVAVSNSSAAVRDVLIGLVEVFERSDDVGRNDLMSMEWHTGSERQESRTPAGTFLCTLNDTAQLYFPTNSSSDLYGSVAAGRRVWARATYDGAIYPIFYGTLQRIVPNATLDGSGYLTVDLHAQDPFLDLANADYEAGFTEDATYREIRINALEGLSGNDYTPPGIPGTRKSVTALSVEGSYFFSGNESAPALSVLEALNEATGTYHCIRPSAIAEELWIYRTLDRTVMTDDTISNETIDDDFADLSGIFATDEAMENRQFVPWQGYERQSAPDDDGTGFGAVMQAIDRAGGYGAGVIDGNDPYLHYTDESFCNDDNVPEPTFERITRRNKKGRKKVREIRVYPNPFVPFDMTAGETREFTLDFSKPMSGTVLTLDGPTGASNIVVTTVESYPRHIVFRLFAADDDTVDYFSVGATPWLPLDEQVIDQIDYDSALVTVREGPSYQTPFIGSAGMAEGLATYRNWRYSVGRMTPVLRTENRFPTGIRRKLGQHVTVNAERWGISGQNFIITGIDGLMDTGARNWVVSYNLEEVPAGAPWFELDGPDLDDTDYTLAY